MPIFNPETERQVQEYKKEQQKIYLRFQKEQKTRKFSRKKKKFVNVSDATFWMKEHPMFWDKDCWSHFHECFEWEFVLVNPKTNAIDYDESKNTKLRCWLECGAYVYASVETTAGTMALPGAGHDYKLDCGADTFEQAIMILVQKIFQRYGDYVL